MRQVRVFLGVLLLLGLAGCADSESPGPDGRLRAAGADRVREASRDFAESAPVRRAGDYTQAVAQGLISDPMIARLQPRRVPLAASERCVGGVIVYVNGSTYTQVLAADGKPERCEGDQRIVPPR